MKRQPTMPYTIKVDRNLCVSTVSCVALAGNTFELDEDGISHVKNPTGDPDAAILEAAKNCPVDAIIIYDKSGKKIWPLDKKS